MIPFREQKNLCLVFQAAKGFRMNDPVAVNLETGSKGTRGFMALPSPAV
jgi:hypothetical protein